MPQRIKSRDSYHELTEKMKAIVDAIAENPDAKQREITEIAEEKLDNECVSRSYVSIVKDEHDKIISNCRYKINNRRYEGEQTTEGDPLAEEMRDDGWQLFSERPVTDVGDVGDGDVGTINSDDGNNDSDEIKVEIELGRGDIELLILGDVPESVKNDLSSKLLEMAFK